MLVPVSPNTVNASADHKRSVSVTNLFRGGRDNDRDDHNQKSSQPRKRSLSATSLFGSSDKGKDDRQLFEVPLVEHSGTRKKRNWTDENAVYVKRIGQRAGGFKWMHAKAATYYHHWYHGWGIACIVVSAIASAGNVPFVINCQNDVNWIKITATILGFLVTVALGVQQFKDFGGISERHQNSEANYDAFYEQVKQELQKNSKDRQDATDYVVWIAQAMTNLKNSSPIIPGHILADYRKLISARHIADPEGLDEIIIKEDSPDRALARKRKQSQPQPQPPESNLVEVVVDSGTLPRAGIFEGRRPSEFEKIQMERWNEQDESN